MSTVPSESKSAVDTGAQARNSAVSWLLASLAACMAVLGPLSAERYELLWLAAAPILLLRLERRTVSSLAVQPRRLHLLPIFPVAQGALSVWCQSLFGANHVQMVLMYAFFVLAALTVAWQLLKFFGSWPVPADRGLTYGDRHER